MISYTCACKNNLFSSISFISVMYILECSMLFNPILYQSHSFKRTFRFVSTFELYIFNSLGKLDMGNEYPELILRHKYIYSRCILSSQYFLNISTKKPGYQLSQKGFCGEKN